RWRPDFICLQECGGAPPSGSLLFSVPAGAATPVSVYQWGGTASRPLAWIAFYPWDAAGNRVNLAVLTRTQPAPADVVLAWPVAGPVWRPILGLRTAAVVVFCCHAISPGGADAPGLLAAAQVAAAGVPWVVAGDFNREPNGFAPAGNVVCPPNGPTFS